MSGIHGRAGSWAKIISDTMRKEVNGGYANRVFTIDRARAEINDTNGTARKGYLIDVSDDWAIPGLESINIKPGSYFYQPVTGTVFRDSKPNVPGFQLNPAPQFIEETQVRAK